MDERSDEVLFVCRFEFKWGPRFWLSNGGGKLGDSGQPGSCSWDGSMFLNVLGLVGGELVEWSFPSQKEKKKKNLYIHIYNLIYN